MNLYVIGLAVVTGVFIGWHFPQPAWVAAATAVVKTWLKKKKQ